MNWHNCSATHYALHAIVPDLLEPRTKPQPDSWREWVCRHGWTVKPTHTVVLAAANFTDAASVRTLADPTHGVLTRIHCNLHVNLGFTTGREVYIDLHENCYVRASSSDMADSFRHRGGLSLVIGGRLHFYVHQLRPDWHGYIRPKVG